MPQALVRFLRRPGARHILVAVNGPGPAVPRRRRGVLHPVYPQAEGVVNEIKVRGTPPALPTPESLGALLGRFLQVESIEVDWYTREIRIDGLLVLAREVADAADFRRALLESLDAVIALVAEAGVSWVDHPHVFIAGDVINLSGGRQEFARLSGKATLRVWVPAVP